MSYHHLASYLQLGIFRLEDVCVRIQDEMGAYLTTAALQKTPEIEATLRWLRKRQVKVALISNACRADTEVLLKRLNWEVGEDELLQLVLTDQASKPNPVASVLELAGLNSGATTFSVLDTPRLLESAQASGVHFNIGVTNGCCSYSELVAAPHHTLLDGPVQLPNFLLENLPEQHLGNLPLHKMPPRGPGLRLPRQLPIFFW